MVFQHYETQSSSASSISIPSSTSPSKQQQRRRRRWNMIYFLCLTLYFSIFSNMTGHQYIMIQSSSSLSSDKPSTTRIIRSNIELTLQEQQQKHSTNESKDSKTANGTQSGDNTNYDDNNQDTSISSENTKNENDNHGNDNYNENGDETKATTTATASDVVFVSTTKATMKTTTTTTTAKKNHQQYQQQHSLSFKDTDSPSIRQGSILGGNVDNDIMNKNWKNNYSNSNGTHVGGGGGGGGVKKVFSRPLSLKRIYYFNSIGNPRRRGYMENWLSAQSVPYQRIEALSGHNVDYCYNNTDSKKKHHQQQDQSSCLRNQRIVSSFQRLLKPSWTYNNKNNNNVTGSIMVLHDDSTMIHDIDRLRKFVLGFEEKWNVLFLDCDWEEEEEDVKKKKKKKKKHNHQNNGWYNPRIAMETKYKETGRMEPPKTKVMIFRNKGLLKARELLGDKKLGEKMISLESFFVTRKEFKTYCINMNVTQTNVQLKIDDPVVNVVRNSWILWWKGLQIHEIQRQGRILQKQLQQQLQKQQQQQMINMKKKNKKKYNKNNNINKKKNKNSLQLNTVPQIDRIYYHNLEKNIWRRRGMELWLSQQSIPYKRINATVGEPNVCVEAKNTPNRCKGISGIVKTLTSIIDHEETSGVTLVLEDDVVPLDQTWDRILESIKYVPDDWDIIRFDCWGSGDISAEQWLNSFVFDSRLPKFIPGCVERGCEFCGGAYAMLWRGGDDDTDDDGNRLLKLRTMWNQQPINDADCIIAATPSVQSYCVNIGIWDHLYFSGELSDVSSLRD